MESRVSRLSVLTIYIVTFIFLMAASVSGADEAGRPPGEASSPDVFFRVEAAGSSETNGGADWVVVYDYARNFVKPTGVTYVESHIIHKILTTAGCRDRSVLGWSYDPQSSHVEIKEVNVIREGKKIPVDISMVHDLPAPQRMIYWNDRVKTLQLPELMVGDGIEIMASRKGFTYALLGGGLHEGETAAQDDEQYIPPMPGEYFDIVYFDEEVPVIEKIYILSLPSDKRLHSRVYNGPLYSATTYDEKRTEYQWWGLDIPPRIHEASQPASSDFVTKVVMATAESWEAKSRWFFDVNKNQFEVTDDIREKVEEILKDAGVEKASEERRAEVLLHWVAQNIRYSGQTMGEGEGFTLHPASMIFEQRSGVCKDIAGMLVAMMRAAGMNSFAAMTMAGSRIEDLPADQFNHCVCALMKDDGSIEMYDPTWVPNNNNIWSLLEAEQHYLVGTPEGEDLSRIKYSPPEESPLRIVHDAELGSDGTLKGRVRFSGSGAMDSRLRGLVNSRKKDMTLMFAGLLAPVSERVEIEGYDFPEIDDFSQDMWIELSYRIPKFSFDIDDGFEFRSPMMQVVLSNGRLFRAASAGYGAERKTDIFLYYTQLVDCIEKIKVPKGYKLVDPPASAIVDETYASFSGTSSMKKRVVIINHRAEIRRRQIPPDGFAGFKKAIDEAREWSQVSFRVEKGGK